MMFLRPDRPTEQKKDDNVMPSQEEKKDEGNVEVNYEADSSDEDGPLALSKCRTIDWSSISKWAVALGTTSVT